MAKMPIKWATFGCLLALGVLILARPVRAQIYGQFNPYAPPADSWQPPVYVNPMPNGGSIITQPGATPWQPPVYVNPLPGGGSMITQPGLTPWQPRLPNGGAMITQ